MRKVAFIAAALVGVTAAHASIVITLSQGTYGIGAGTYGTTEALYFSTVSGLNSGDSLSYLSQASIGGLGTATFSNGTDQLVLDTQINSVSSSPYTYSIEGVWNYDAALSTGVFSGYSGSGTFSQSLHALANNFAASEFVGNLEAVPEPASMIAMGLGAVAFIRRRNRK